MAAGRSLARLAFEKDVSGGVLGRTGRGLSPPENVGYLHR
jgi:hypothetical protein